MMKKNYLLLSVLLLMWVITTAQTNEGVIINGVKWATCNVDSAGKFAANEYAAGMMYQWNSKVGWPATGNIGSVVATDGSTTWNTNWKGGYEEQWGTDKWLKENDPSPSGWRVPNRNEIDKLFDKTKVSYQQVYNNDWTYWYNQFTDIATGNKLILPHYGYRSKTSVGTVEYQSIAKYWTTFASDMGVYCLYADLFASWEFISRADGLLIRPVADVETKTPNILFESRIKIFPTMVTDNFSIEGVMGDISIQILNSSGKLLFSKQINCNDNINVSDLPKGIYIVSITSKEGTAHKKFIKK